MFIVPPFEDFSLWLFSKCPFIVCRCLFLPFGENQASMCPSPVLSAPCIFCALSEVGVSSSATHLQILQLPWDVIYRGQDTWTHLEPPCALSSSFTSLACQFLGSFLSLHSESPSHWQRPKQKRNGRFCLQLLFGNIRASVQPRSWPRLVFGHQL